MKGDFCNLPERLLTRDTALRPSAGIDAHVEAIKFFTELIVQADQSTSL
jgi:hypothetical protein